MYLIEFLLRKGYIFVKTIVLTTPVGGKVSIEIHPRTARDHVRPSIFAPKSL